MNLTLTFCLGHNVTVQPGSSRSRCQDIGAVDRKLHEEVFQTAGQAFGQRSRFRVEEVSVESVPQARTVRDVLNASHFRAADS